MRLHFGLVLLLFIVISQLAMGADAPYAPLWLYNGAWRVSKKGQNAKPDELVNHCAQYAKYFACEQTVNGSVSALLVFVPGNKPGEYRTQSIMPDGRAGGLGGLTIQGDTWTYTSNWNQGGGHSTYYKTINVFSGKNRIRFEQQESANNKDWKTTNSGDEVRIAPGRPIVVH